MNSQSNPQLSNLDMFVAEITGNSESSYSGVELQVSLRIQSHINAQLTAIMALYDMHAREKGRRPSSRNTVLNELLAIALDAVVTRLNHDDKDFFDQFYSPAFAGALSYVEDEDMDDFKKQIKHKREKHEQSKQSKESK
jgi:hypothetical protein